jgi:hypothetical protein
VAANINCDHIKQLFVFEMAPSLPCRIRGDGSEDLNAPSFRRLKVRNVVDVERREVDVLDQETRVQRPFFAPSERFCERIRLRRLG